MNTYLHTRDLVGFGLIIYLIVLGPLVDMVVLRRLQTNCTSRQRVRLYISGLLTSIAAAGAAVYVVGASRLATAGTVLPRVQETVSAPVRAICLVLAVAFLALATLPFFISRRDRTMHDKYARAIRKTSFRYLFPTSAIERRWFAALCVNAGVTEEIVFRSFMLDFLHRSPLTLTPFAGLAVSSIVFGLNHAYQGFAGVIKTGITGLMMGFLYYSTGSLVLCMIVHALVDLQVLVMLKEGWSQDVRAGELVPAPSPAPA